MAVKVWRSPGPSPHPGFLAGSSAALQLLGATLLQLDVRGLCGTKEPLPGSRAQAVLRG